MLFFGGGACFGFAFLFVFFFISPPSLYFSVITFSLESLAPQGAVWLPCCSPCTVLYPCPLSILCAKHVLLQGLGVDQFVIGCAADDNINDTCFVSHIQSQDMVLLIASSAWCYATGDSFPRLSVSANSGLGLQVSATISV